MNVYRRYFRVKTGPLVEAVIEGNNVNSVARESYRSIVEEVGAELGYYQRGQKLVSMIFKGTPDKKRFKQCDGGWYPKKNCKAGKELAARLEAIETRDLQECLEVVGLSRLPSIFSGGRCYHATLTVIPEKPPIIYVNVPWYDADPDALKLYEKERSNGKHFDSSLDAVLWNPAPEMAEVKGWEVDRHIDEWNEKVKTENAA